MTVKEKILFYSQIVTCDNSMRGVRGCESIVRYTAKSRRYEIGYDGRSIHRPCHIFYFHHNAYLDTELVPSL